MKQVVIDTGRIGRPVYFYFLPIKLRFYPTIFTEKSRYVCIHSVVGMLPCATGAMEEDKLHDQGENYMILVTDVNKNLSLIGALSLTLRTLSKYWTKISVTIATKVKAGMLPLLDIRDFSFYSREISENFC